jgi:hypothetical protein
VQQWVDAGGLAGRCAVTAEGVREIHRRFCELLPDDLLFVEIRKPESVFAWCPENCGVST